MNNTLLVYYLGRMSALAREIVSGKNVYGDTRLVRKPHEVRAFGQQVEAIGEFFLANPHLHHKGSLFKYENDKPVAACLIGCREASRRFHVPPLPATRDLNKMQFADMAFSSGLVFLNDQPDFTTLQTAKLFIRFGKVIQAWAQGDMTVASMEALLKKRFPQAAPSPKV